MGKINPLRVFQAVVYRLLWPKNHFCILCNHSFHRFLPYRGGSADVAPLMWAVDIVGSDVEHFQCPWCGCHDRERHLFLYMSSVGLFDDFSRQTVLHFAPEKILSQHIQALGPAYYIPCDLFPTVPDVMKVNILDIPLGNGSVDVLLANHVMEHVADDGRALAEIVRVLKPGGYAILQTPYSSKLHHTWSDSGIDSDEARLQAYGQEDHMRLYGQDIFECFERAGLRSEVRTHRELLPAIDSVRFGVNEAEPFFLFYKPS